MAHKDAKQRGRGQLTRMQEKAVAALILEPTIDAAAQKAGVSDRTLHRWLKLPAFQEAYGAAKRRVHDHAIDSIQGITQKAVAALELSLESEKPADRIKAAATILNHATRGKEVRDMVRQINYLQAELAKKQGPHGKHESKAATRQTSETNRELTELGAIGDGTADDFGLETGQSELDDIGGDDSRPLAIPAPPFGLITDATPVQQAIR